MSCIHITKLNSKIEKLADEITKNENDDSGIVNTVNTHIADTSNPHKVTKAQVGLGAVTNDAQVKRSEMGKANGIATLDASGKLPAAQLIQLDVIADATTDTLLATVNSLLAALKTKGYMKSK